MSNKKIYQAAFASASLLSFIVPPGALGNEPVRKSTMLEEIIVTAQKREESLQETPIAISAFSGEEIERKRISNVKDLKFFTPSLDVGEGFNGATYLQIRGIGNDVIVNGADPGVAVHLDGTFLGTQQYFDSSFFDVERIEVLRGPQGTVYGRNATGGNINIVTRDPTEEFDGNAAITLGNYDNVETEAAISGPLIGEKVLGRIALVSKRHDGYTPAVNTGQELDDADRIAGRAKLKPESVT
ncbi:TonB-dependent receptor [Sedimenticola sp.]|uniref:TonB-dependent receptor n=1 Tax=Sedimenticola sp. TaxID=1940285 RepID=UPI003D10BCD7